MSYYNKDILKKKEEIDNIRKCDYSFCYHYADIECPYGAYCDYHWIKIKTYYKKEVIKILK